MGCAEETWVDGEAAPAAAAPRQEVAARYLLLERIGAGAMGVVHRAFDPMLQREVAVKLLGKDAAGARMLREGQLLARLSHPNVVAIHDVGWSDGRGFLAMELVRGRPLDRWLSEVRPDRDAILDVFLQAARGLAAAHRMGIVHRDFKPSNVLVGDDGVVRVADFGIARMAGAATAPDARADSTITAHAELTHPGGAVGTPAYMAPEQAAGEPVDERCDQYAFCLSLRRALGADMTGRIARVVERGLRHAPAARFRGMHELIAALERARRVRWRAPAVAALVAALVIAATLAAGRAEPPAAPPPDALATLLEAHAHANGPALADSHIALAREYRRRGDLERARFHGDEALRLLDARDPRMVAARSGRGQTALRQGQLDVARRLFDDAVRLGEELGGPMSTALVDPLMNLATLAKDAGELPQARTLLLRAEAIERADPRADGYRLSLVVNQLAVVARHEGRLADARGYLEEALALKTRVLGAAHVEVAGGILNLGNVLRDQGDADGAEAAYRRSLDAMTRALGADHAHVGLPLMNLGLLALDRGRLVEARRWLERSLAVRRAGLGERHGLVSQTLSILGDVHFREGDAAGALALCARALDAELAPSTHAQAAVCLARAHIAAGHHGQARAALEAAVARFGATEGDWELVGDLHQLLAVVLEHEGGDPARVVTLKARAEACYRKARA